MTKANEGKTANERQVGGDHYKTGGLECWDLFGPEFLVGCAVKHVSRWRKKNGLQDLEKALHYAQKLKEINPQHRHKFNLAIANDLVDAWLQNSGLDWVEQTICNHLLYCHDMPDIIDDAIAGIEYLIARERGKTTLQSTVDLRVEHGTQVKWKSYREMTDDELATELQALETKQSQATGWGAAVGVRGGYIDEIKREQRRRREVRAEDTFGGLRPKPEDVKCKGCGVVTPYGVLRPWWSDGKDLYHYECRPEESK